MGAIQGHEVVKGKRRITLVAHQQQVRDLARDFNSISPQVRDARGKAWRTSFTMKSEG